MKLEMPAEVIQEFNRLYPGMDLKKAYEQNMDNCRQMVRRVRKSITIKHAQYQWICVNIPKTPKEELLEYGMPAWHKLGEPKKKGDELTATDLAMLKLLGDSSTRELPDDSEEADRRSEFEEKCVNYYKRYNKLDIDALMDKDNDLLMVFHFAVQRKNLI